MSYINFNPILIMVLSLLFVCPVRAQSISPPQAGATPDSKADKFPSNAEAERAAKARREHAGSLLMSLAVDARTFGDHALRALTQARVADALWEIDPEQSRGLFRRAWDAAEIADKEVRQRAGVNLTYIEPTNSRTEVLHLASRRDRELGEEFLEGFKEQKEQDSKDVPQRLNVGPFRIPDEAARQRLNLAQQLLNGGDIDRAIQFADSALGFVNIEAIDFLSSLREKNSTAADQRYARLLMLARADLQSDTDTVSILSSYVFTPHLYVVSQGRVVLTSRVLPANVEAQLTTAFFRTAADILLRQMLVSDQAQSVSLGEGGYSVVNHLALLFEQSGPKEVADALRAQLARRAAALPDGVRERDDDWRTKWLSPTSKSTDREQSLLDQIDHAKSSSQRDQLYLQLALITAEKGDIRARDFADKVEDSELRKACRSYVDADLAIRSIEKKEPERALDLVRTGELNHIQRVWVMTQAAKLLTKTSRQKSIVVLDDAAKEADRIDRSDPDRPRALIAVANGFLTTDRARAWDMAFDAVKAANSAEGFIGEGGQLTISIAAMGRGSRRNISAPDFDVGGLFSKLATDDYDRAIQTANGFKGEEPRAIAVIAIARSILDSKQGPVKPETRANGGSNRDR